MFQYERPKSPYLERNLNPKGKEKEYLYITDHQKLHRIRSRHPFYGEIVSIVSPSEIWVRPINHIADDLMVSIKCFIPQVRILEPGKYVMALYDDKRYARARILLTAEDGALLRFIDHGFIAYRRQMEMRELQKPWMYYPWQTILTALHEAIPMDTKTWTTEEIKLLNKAAYSYDAVYVMPEKTEKYWDLDDSTPIRCRFNCMSIMETSRKGKRINGEKVGEGLLELFELRLPPRQDLLINDGFKHDLYPGGHFFGNPYADPMNVTADFLGEKGYEIESKRDDFYKFLV